MGLDARREREGNRDTPTLGGVTERKEPARESKEEQPLMWKDNEMHMFENYMTLNILNFMVFHQGGHAFCWSARQTNVGILVEKSVLQTKYLLISVSKNGENSEGLG